MFIKTMRVSLALAVVLGLFLGAGGTSLPTAHASPGVDVLIVIEVQSPQLVGLATLFSAALRNSGLFATVDEKSVTVSRSGEDPLGKNTTGVQYDLIIILPIGVEQGVLTQIWLVTCPITTATPQELLAGLQFIQELVATGTQGQIQAAGVQDDLIPGLFSTLFQRNGWLRGC